MKPSAWESEKVNKIPAGVCVCALGSAAERLCESGSRSHASLSLSRFWFTERNFGRMISHPPGSFRSVLHSVSLVLAGRSLSSFCRKYPVCVWTTLLRTAVSICEPLHSQRVCVLVGIGEFANVFGNLPKTHFECGERGIFRQNANDCVP